MRVLMTWMGKKRWRGSSRWRMMEILKYVDWEEEVEGELDEMRGRWWRGMRIRCFWRKWRRNRRMEKGDE